MSLRSQTLCKTHILTQNQTLVNDPFQLGNDADFNSYFRLALARVDVGYEEFALGENRIRLEHYSNRHISQCRFSLSYFDWYQGSLEKNMSFTE